MDTINHASNANDHGIGAKEADEGGVGAIEVASVKDYEAHNTATDANEDADEAIGWVGGRPEAMEDVDDARKTGVDREHDELEDKFVVGEEDEDEGGEDIDAGINDGIHPAVLFGGIIEGASGINDAHR